jgi:serine/threonine protein kinase
LAIRSRSKDYGDEVPLLACKTSEVIAGYTLGERIGAGGYGEVWKADAPGGLVKAIKFVYGYLDEERAARELKALCRIKEVRHPFLLSLERIEVIDGRLVIVTELADGSLNDRFEQCVKQGLPGIPRPELLVYLQDAADGLDYMREQFSLQHLDIKPENLLLVGHRAKIADFGLVKDIHEATISMGCLTPVYAAPEVFAGHPSLHSDQYSLAIVFVEMLTGDLPFPGRTPKQLEAQHLSTHPRLVSLPVADRSIIARALAKRAEDRFPSCRAMVDELTHAAAAVASHPATAASAVRAGDTEAPGSPTTGTAGGEQHSGRSAVSGSARAARTLVLGDLSESDPPSAAAAVEEDAIPWPLGLPDAEPIVDELPPLASPPPVSRLRPTLLIGVGGMGAMALGRLRLRLHDRFIDLTQIPAIQMLVLDVDARVTSEAAAGDTLARFEPHETLTLPLRSTEGYRDDWQEHLRWLGRRWLCNIPRSHRTEGIRPLGRLALVDHAAQVLERLRTALGAMIDPAKVAVSADATGMPFDDSPRIVIVGSISGGAASGMILDLAYLVRRAMADVNMPTSRLCGILAHSTNSNPSDKLIASLNACACLHEWEHYNGAAGYPGEFDDTYLVHLGSELSDEGYESATRLLAEYLFVDVATAAGPFLESCRREPIDEPDKRVRTFAVRRAGASRAGLCTLVVDALCLKVVDRWLGSAEGGHDGVVEVTPMAMMADVHRLFEEELGGPLEQVVERVSAPRLAALAAHPSDIQQRALPSQLVDDLNGLFETIREKDDDEQGRSARFQPKTAARLKAMGEALAARAADQIVQSFANSGSGVANGIAAAQSALARIKAIKLELAGKQPIRQVLVEQLERGLRGNPAPFERQRSWLGIGRPTQVLAPCWLEFANAKLELLTLHAMAHLLQNLASRLAAIVDQLNGLRFELNQLKATFAPPATAADGEPAETDADDGDDPQRRVADAMGEPLRQLAAELDAAWRAGLFPKGAGLHGCLGEPAWLNAGFSERMRTGARTTVFPLLASCDAASALVDDRLLDSIDELPCATPLAVGGRRRLWLIAPSPRHAEALRQRLDERGESRVSIVIDAHADALVCVEGDGISAARVAAEWIEHDGDHARIAARIAARVDVDWTR